MHTLELFAGCGGLAKGLELAGFRHAGLLEINHQACESLRANFNPAIVHEMDVTKVDFREFGTVDVVSGGPPCQPFSLGGLAKAYNDKRDMFPQAIRAISEIRPKAFVFENVKGLLRAKFSPYFNYIVMRLSYPDCRVKKGETWKDHAERLERVADGLMEYDGLRYHVHFKLLNAVDYGVPQIRERVFIVGFREDVPVRWSWPEPLCKTKSSRMTIRDAIKDLPDPRSRTNHIPDHKFIDGARTYPGHTGSDVSLPSKTVKAGAHGVPGGENMLRFADGSVRYMTVHEAKRIQSFPSDFAITGSWGEALRQIGNAVPVRLAQAVGAQLHTLLAKALSRRGETEGEFHCPECLKGEQMMLAMEPPAVYQVCKRPLTLFATYPRANAKWIVEKRLYNYPIRRDDAEAAKRMALAMRLVLQNRNSEPMWFSIVGSRMVSKKELQELDYPHQGRHARYMLFSLSPMRKPAFVFRESAYQVIIGKGRTYQQFIRHFS